MYHAHHDHCVHALKFCVQCDKPYCTKCGREWGLGWTLTTNPWYSGQWLGTHVYTGSTAGVTNVTSGGSGLNTAHIHS